MYIPRLNKRGSPFGGSFLESGGNLQIFGGTIQKIGGSLLKIGGTTTLSLTSLRKDCPNGQPLRIYLFTISVFCSHPIIASINASPYLVSLFSPTPLIVKNALAVFGRLSHSSFNVLSENTT